MHVCLCVCQGAGSDPWSSGSPPPGGAGAFGSGGGLDAFGAPAATNGTNGASSTLDNEFDLLSSRSNDNSPSKTGGANNLDDFDLLSGECQEFIFDTRIDYPSKLFLMYKMVQIKQFGLDSFPSSV